jgi:hypothetical protein
MEKNRKQAIGKLIHRFNFENNRWKKLLLLLIKHSQEIPRK